jgi:hypothetical protein
MVLSLAMWTSLAPPQVKACPLGSCRRPVRNGLQRNRAGSDGRQPHRDDEATDRRDLRRALDSISFRPAQWIGPLQPERLSAVVGMRAVRVPTGPPDLPPVGGGATAPAELCGRYTSGRIPISEPREPFSFLATSAFIPPHRCAWSLPQGKSDPYPKGFCGTGRSRRNTQNNVVRRPPGRTRGPLEPLATL